MKKLPALLLFIFGFQDGLAQSWDTVVSNNVYRSYFSDGLHEPVMVVYMLFHGGGDCSRSKFHFKNDSNLPTAEPKDYLKCGYDEGHMANAEDFAFDCTLDELTFRFYNCVPQTPNLNRGIYKKWESEIRRESQSDSLLIICGNIFGPNPERIGRDSIAVPEFCYKVVESLSAHIILHVLLFKNETPASCDTTETESQLEKTLGYKLPLESMK